MYTYNMGQDTPTYKDRRDKTLKVHVEIMKPHWGQAVLYDTVVLVACHDLLKLRCFDDWS